MYKRQIHLWQHFDDTSVSNLALLFLDCSETRSEILKDFLGYDEANKTKKHDLYKRIAILVVYVAQWSKPHSYGDVIIHFLEIDGNVTRAAINSQRVMSSFDISQSP